MNEDTVESLQDAVSNVQEEEKRLEEAMDAEVSDSSSPFHGLDTFTLTKHYEEGELEDAFGWLRERTTFLYGADEVTGVRGAVNTDPFERRNEETPDITAEIEFTIATHA